MRLEVQRTQENAWGVDRHVQFYVIVFFAHFLLIFCIFMHFSRFRMHWDATWKQGDLGRVGHIESHSVFLRVSDLIIP